MSRLGTCETGCSDTRSSWSPPPRTRRSAPRWMTPGRAPRPSHAPYSRWLATSPAQTGSSARIGLRNPPPRQVLRHHPAVHPHETDATPPDQLATAWWCAECGGIDTPQPCLGVCVWRPIDWVNRSRYEQLRELAASERETERRVCRPEVLQRSVRGPAAAVGGDRSSSRDGARTGRRCSWRAISAIRAERLAEPGPGRAAPATCVCGRGPPGAIRCRDRAPATARASSARGARAPRDARRRERRASPHPAW